MKIHKVIFLGLLLFSSSIVLNAQTDESRGVDEQVEGDNRLMNDDIVFFELRTDTQKLMVTLDESFFKKEVQKELIHVFINDDTHKLSVSIDTTKVKLQKIRKKLDAIGLVLLVPETKIVELEVKRPVEKYRPEIDVFLNIEDTTIFTRKFENYDLKAMHSSRKNYYQVIRIIHSLDSILKTVEGSLSIVKASEIAKEFSISVEVAKNLLLDAAKNDLEKAELELDSLIPLRNELDYLSQQQKRFYNSLKNKFNNLYSKVYPD